KFPAVAFLLIYGHLPTLDELKAWRAALTRHSYIHESMNNFFDHFPHSAHPMAILSSMVSTLSTFTPGYEDDGDLDLNIMRLMAQVKTIAAFSYKKSVGEPVVYPRKEYSYCANFLRMMFSTPVEEYEVSESLERVLNMLLILH